MNTDDPLHGAASSDESDSSSDFVNSPLDASSSHNDSSSESAGKLAPDSGSEPLSDPFYDESSDESSDASSWDSFEDLDGEIRAAPEDIVRRNFEAAQAETQLPKLEAGRLIGQRYRILGPLGGVSGQGHVYQAEDTRTHGKLVAIKVYAGKFQRRRDAGKASIQTPSTTDDSHRRIQAEGEILAKLVDDRIVAVHDTGRLEDGRHYFVMDFIPGATLEKHCEQQRLDVDEIVKRMVEVCRGIQAAHQKSIFHHDVKPTNVLVVMEGLRARVKIVDFGLAHRLDQAAQVAMFYPGRGTEGYAAPELRQRDSEFAEFSEGPAPDVYSIGATLFRLLAHVSYPTPASPRDDAWHTMPRGVRAKAVASETRSSARMPDNATRLIEQHLEALGGDLGWIIAKACRYDPRARYESVQQLQQDLERFLARKPIEARKEAGQATLAYRGRLFLDRNRVWLAIASLLMVVAVAVGTPILWEYLGQRRRAADAIAERELARKAARDEQLLRRKQLALNQHVQGERAWNEGDWRASVWAQTRAWLAYPTNDATREGILRVAVDKASQGGRVWPIPFVLGQSIKRTILNRAGDRVALVGFGELQLFDLATAEPLGSQRGSWEYDSVHFSPDDSALVAQTRDREIVEWDARTGQLNGKFQPGESRWVVGWSATGREHYVLARTRRRVELWERLGQRRLTTAELPEKGGWGGLQFHRDQAAISMSVDVELESKEQDLAKKKAVKSKSTRRQATWIWRLRDVPSVQVVTASPDDVWGERIYATVVSPDLKRRIDLAEIPVTPNNGRVETTDYRARLWDLTANQQIGDEWSHPVASEHGMTTHIHACFDAEGGSAWTVGANDRLMQVDAATGKVIARIALPHERWESVYLTEDERIECGSFKADPWYFTYDPRQGLGVADLRRPHSRMAHDDRGLSYYFSDRYTCQARGLRVAQRELASIPKPHPTSSEPHLSPDGAAVAISYDRGLQVWSTMEPELDSIHDKFLGCEKAIKYGAHDYDHLLFAPDGAYALWVFKEIGVAYRVDLATWAAPLALDRMGLWAPWAAMYSPGGVGGFGMSATSPTFSSIARSSQSGTQTRNAAGRVLEWRNQERLVRDAETLRVTHRRGHSTPLAPLESAGDRLGVTRSPLEYAGEPRWATRSSTRLLVSDDRENLLLLNANSLAIVKSLGPYQESPPPYFSPSGRWVVAYSATLAESEVHGRALGPQPQNGKLRLYSSEDGELVARLPVTGEIRQRRFVGDERNLLVTYEDGQWQLWEIATGKQVADSATAMSAEKGESREHANLSDKNGAVTVEDSWESDGDPVVAENRRVFLTFRSRYVNESRAIECRAINAKTGTPLGPWFNSPINSLLDRFDDRFDEVARLTPDGRFLVIFDNETIEGAMRLHRVALNSGRWMTSGSLRVLPGSESEDYLDWASDSLAQRVAVLVNQDDENCWLRMYAWDKRAWVQEPSLVRIPKVWRGTFEFSKFDETLVFVHPERNRELVWKADTLEPIDVAGQVRGADELLELTDWTPANARPRRDSELGASEMPAKFQPLSTSRGYVDAATGSPLMEWNRLAAWGDAIAMASEDGGLLAPADDKSRRAYVELVAGLRSRQALASSPVSHQFSDIQDQLKSWAELKSTKDGADWLAAQRKRFSDRSWLRSRVLADRRLVVGDWSSALFHLNHAVAKDPSDADGHWDRALCLATLWRWDEARAAYLRACELTSRDPSELADDAWLELAVGNTQTSQTRVIRLKQARQAAKVQAEQETAPQSRQSVEDDEALDEELQILEEALSGFPEQIAKVNASPDLRLLAVVKKQPELGVTSKTHRQSLMETAGFSPLLASLAAEARGDRESMRQWYDRARIELDDIRPELGHDQPWGWKNRVIVEHLRRLVEKRLP